MRTSFVRATWPEAASVLMFAVALVVALVGAAPRAAAQGPVPCFLTAGGTIDPEETGRDVFGGAAALHHDGTLRGHWNHVTQSGDHLVGGVNHLRCRRDGGGASNPPPGALANLVDIDGPALWNGTPGYCYRAHLEDHGEPNTHDFYSITVVADAVFDGDGNCVAGDFLYFRGGLVLDGNVQVH